MGKLCWYELKKLVKRPFLLAALGVLLAAALLLSCGLREYYAAENELRALGVEPGSQGSFWEFTALGRRSAELAAPRYAVIEGLSEQEEADFVQAMEEQYGPDVLTGGADAALSPTPEMTAVPGYFPQYSDWDAILTYQDLLGRNQRLEEQLQRVLRAGEDFLAEAEEEGDAYGVRRKHILGGHCDGLMNYPFRNSLLGYLMGGKAEDFRAAMETIRENYPPFAWRTAMNFLGTHDTPRILTLLGCGTDGQDHDKDWRAAYHMTESQYLLGRTKLMLGALVLFAFPGSPTVYYGDEAGMEGFEDPFNRRTYPWGSEDQTLLDWYTALGKARKELPALRRGDLFWGQTQGRLLTFLRQGEGEPVLAAVNVGKAPEPITLPWPAEDWMSGLKLPAGPVALPPMTGWLLTPSRSN